MVFLLQFLLQLLNLYLVGPFELIHNVELAAVVQLELLEELTLLLFQLVRFDRQLLLHPLELGVMQLHLQLLLLGPVLRQT